MDGLSVIGRARIVFACAVLSSAGCASTPHSPTTDQVTQAVDTHAKVYPTLQFIVGDHRYALYGLNENGALDERAFRKANSSMLILEDEQMLGRLDSGTALAHLACFAESDGALLLAARLRSLTTDHPGKQHASAEDDHMCPWQPERAPTEEEAIAMVEAHEWTDAQPEESDDTGASDAVQGTHKPMSTGTKVAAVAGGAFLLAFPPILGLLVVEAGADAAAHLATDGVFGAYDSARDHAGLVAQAKIQLGMDAAALTNLLGEPTQTCEMEPGLLRCNGRTASHTTSTSSAGKRVLCYERHGKNSLPLTVGIVDERVAWVLYGQSI